MRNLAREVAAMAQRTAVVRERAYGWADPEPASSLSAVTA